MTSADLRLKLDTARAEAARLRSAHTAADKLADAARAFDRSVLALGGEPDVPVLGKAPAPPDGERPSLDDRNVATATIANATKAEGAGAERKRRMESAERAVVAATTQVEDATADVAHMEALVEACRAAPGKMLEKQRAALGDMGPVSLEFTDTGVTVLVNGRPWDAPLAVSSGELVAADLAFRGALRRVAKLGWLHLFVDDASLWSGAWPDVGDRVVRLVTEDRDGIAVRPAAPVAMVAK